jgi:ribosomal protein S27AE
MVPRKVSEADGKIPSMMYPLNDHLDDSSSVPYDIPRGTCPRCGSAEVRHLVIGMPTGPGAFDTTPDWVTWVGCMHPGHDRECARCGTAWTFDGPSRLHYPGSR